MIKEVSVQSSSKILARLLRVIIRLRIHMVLISFVRMKNLKMPANKLQRKLRRMLRRKFQKICIKSHPNKHL
jgi:hypothetical protein